MKRNLAAITSCIFFILGAKAQNNTAITGNMLTLQQCIETALSNNLQVKQNELIAQTDNVNLQQAKAYMLPTLSGNASQGINTGKSIDPFTNSYINQQVSYSNYGINAGVTLFSGFQLVNNVKQNALTYEAGKMDLQQSKDNLTLNVLLSYLQVLSNEDQLTIAKSSAETTLRQVERLEIQNSVGAITPSILSDLKGNYAGNQLNIVNAQNALENSKLALFQLMNVPYKKNMTMQRLILDTSMNIYSATSDSIYHTAMEKLALVKAAELRTQSAEKGVKVAQSQYYPTLSLSGGLNSNYSSAAVTSSLLGTTDVATSNYVLINGNKTPVFSPQGSYSISKIAYGDQLSNNFNSSFSLGLHVPIFNSFRAKNNVKLARIALKTAEITEQATNVQLQQTIEQAYVNMTASYNRYKATLDQVAAYAESFREAEIRFNAGASTSVDYIIAKNNIDNANTGLSAVKYDYIFRTKILDFYQNKPLW